MAEQINQALILCGGEGERLGYAADAVPKPLVEVGGKPFITYAINMLKGIGIRDIILLTKDKAKYFSYLSGSTVRVVESQGNIDEGVMSIIEQLDGMFLLLNGDLFPIMDWRGFISTCRPKVAVKIIGRDAGAAIVKREDIVSGYISCSDIKGMMDKYENYIVLGGLHIGTPEGLQRARTFIDIAVYGE